VHQDLGLVPSLSAVENLFVGDITSHWSWRLSWRAERRRAAAIFADYGVEIDPASPVAELTQVERATLAIVRALANSGRGHRAISRTLLVLDEPTVFLPRTGVEQLFALVRSIVARGASVLFVSHDLAQIQEITDRVTVLRDGRLQGTVATGEATELDLIEMIVGRRFVPVVVAHPPASGEAYVSVSVEAQNIAPLELSVHRGEIIGLTGLIGSGFDRVLQLIFGAGTDASGWLTIDERAIALDSLTPQLALELGIVLIPADRQRDGSVAELSIAENVMLPVLHRYVRGLRLRRREIASDAYALLEQFDVRPNLPRARFETLSGGNQQKAMLAKWLQLEPKVLLLDEPTQGVDVGAREQIFGIITAAATRGGAVICASSDYDQLARLCDRVLIFARGAVVSELRGEQISKEAISEESFNSLSALPAAAASARVPPLHSGEGFA
jgi:ribose transport system ATP-binding protein